MDRSKSRATGYTDFYKRSSNPPEPAGAKLGNKYGAVTDDEEMPNDAKARKEAIKRRLRRGKVGK
jgi:hypothetical protein